MYIGSSLSLCVLSILKGEVTEGDVDKIVANTYAPDDKAWKTVVAKYSRTIWGIDPEECAAIANRLWDTGKIDQPRLRDGAPCRPVDSETWVLV